MTLYSKCILIEDELCASLSVGHLQRCNVKSKNNRTDKPECGLRME